MIPSPPQAPTSPFSLIGGYVSTLRELATKATNESEWNVRCHAVLNGEANKQIRLAIPLRTRRKFGAFFTGSELRKRLLSHLSPCDSSSLFYDPTCGMGDLLLAVANLLPLKSTLIETLHSWGSQLAGTDLHSEFIEGAKSRLVVLARQRHGAFAEGNALEFDFFPLIRTGNALDQVSEYRRATHILMNPPFGAVKVGKKCKWAAGQVTAAAVFIADALLKIEPGVQILAVLPEVLRSGSFSENWRQEVSKLACVSLVEPYGVFDEAADIDVFLLGLVRRGDDKLNELKWPAQPKTDSATLGDLFDVHVGKVVPHRDKNKGLLYPYIHSRCVPPWTVMTEFSEDRRHKSPGYIPPFVAIRRTSRPDQPYRATATVISGNKPVAVENHLLVCEPKDGKLDTCLQLMTQLQSEPVNAYLNERIRCRHLTVSSVSDIPVSLPNP